MTLLLTQACELYRVCEELGTDSMQGDGGLEGLRCEY